MIPVHLAVGDALSEAALRCALRSASPAYVIGQTYGLRGSGYLRNKADGWNRAAQGKPLVLLTDLDNYACPPDLLAEWLPRGVHPNLLLRVAVHEVESWLLADHTGCAALLGIRESLLPESPDNIPDPKAALIELARRSRRSDVRRMLVPRQGSTATQGPEYNQCLVPLVRQHWDVRAAAKRSTSLQRALAKFQAFRPVWQTARPPARLKPE